MKKQLILCLDMEGASGIFEHNRSAMVHGTKEWREYGRACLTSDVCAICEAANTYGIEEILIYDGHYAGDPEPNLLLERLPSNARLFDTPNREFHWRRIRGQAQWEPFGLITAGQHARYGVENAYFPHTIQSPPINDYLINGIPVAEIGSAVLNFYGTPYLANVGCQASMAEARALSDTVSLIAVKDKSRNWEPSPEETYPLIRDGVLAALRDQASKAPAAIEPPYHFSLDLVDGFCFAPPETISWKGGFTKTQAYWEAPSLEIGLELFHDVRACITKG